MSSTTKVADRLHKLCVTGLMGLTAVLSVTFGFQLYHYFTNIRADRKKLASREAESTVLTENISAISMAFAQRISRLFLFSELKAVSNCSRSMSDKKSWNILKVNHVAVATKDLDNSSKFYRDVLGAKTSEAIPMPEHGVQTVFVELLNTKIELLLPFGNQSPIENFLEKNPSGGMHHICLEVDNLENAVEDLKAKKIRLLGDKPKIGAHGKLVIFLHPKDCGGVLIELEEV